MSTINKQIERLKSLTNDYSFKKAKSLAEKLGYTIQTKGSTSGSRIMFVKNIYNIDGILLCTLKILLHKPHPGDIMKLYAVKDFLYALERNGDI